MNLTKSLQSLLDEISTELVKSTYLNDEKMQIVQQTLNSDLCPYYQYTFCYPDKLSQYPYYDSESYANILSGGITGFVAQVYKYSISDFTAEKETLQYSSDLEQLQIQVQEQVFKNIFIQYIQDIQFTMYNLFAEFNDGNSYAGETLLSYMNYYSFGFRLSLIVVYNLIDFIRIRQSVKELDKLKYILLVLPEQKFENQIIKQKINEISKYFFEFIYICIQQQNQLIIKTILQWSYILLLMLPNEQFLWILILPCFHISRLIQQSHRELFYWHDLYNNQAFLQAFQTQFYS